MFVRKLHVGPIRARCEASGRDVSHSNLGTEKGENMKPSTKDQIEGTFHEVKGKVKEKAGEVTNNPDLTTQGKAEKLAGKVQKKVGEIEKVLEK